MKRKLASRAQLQKHLRYDPGTGLFWWRVNQSGRRVESPAGAEEEPLGYRRICVNRKRYMAHRIAWLFMTGKWPVCFIDHIDGNPRNNKWKNLREATFSQNQQNSNGKRNTVAGFKGVLWHVRCQKWQAKIFYNKKQHYLGLHDTPEDAHAAYRKAARQHFGKYARF